MGVDLGRLCIEEEQTRTAGSGWRELKSRLDNEVDLSSLCRRSREEERVREIAGAGRKKVVLT